MTIPCPAFGGAFFCVEERKLSPPTLDSQGVS